jgi:Putative transposase
MARRDFGIAFCSGLRQRPYAPSLPIKHLGAEIGFFAVLHTWGQNLLHHPHLHCVVAGGGLSPEGTQWNCCRAGFFLPVWVLSRLFLESLLKAFDAGKLEFFSSLDSLRDRNTFLGMPAPEPAISKAGTDYRDRYEELTGSSLWECPVCHKGRMLVIEILPPSLDRHVTPIKDTS